MRADNLNKYTQNLKIRKKSPVNLINNSLLNQKYKQNKLGDDNFLDRNRRDYSKSSERIYRNTVSNILRTSNDQSFNKSPTNSVKNNYDNKTLNEKTNYNIMKKIINNNHYNVGTTFNNYLNNNPNKNNMNQTLTNRNQTLSKVRVSGNYTKPKNETSSSLNYNLHINDNNQFKNYNKIQINNGDVSSKSQNLRDENKIKSDLKNLNKFSGNGKITYSQDFNFGANITNNDISLNNSEIIHYQKENKNYGPIHSTHKKAISTRAIIENQNLNMNEIHKYEMNKKLNNLSPNRFNNHNTLKKNTVMTKPLIKERIHTPTNKETNKLYNNQTITNNNFHNDRSKNLNKKSINQNQNQKIQGKIKFIFVDKNQALYENKKHNMINTDNIINDYKNTLKNKKIYINTKKEDLNDNNSNPNYSKQRNLLNNKTSRENNKTNGEFRNNLSPNALKNQTNQKKVNFQESLKNKREIFSKKLLNNRNDMNSSFQNNNDRIYIKQTLNTRNIMNNKSNELKTNNTSRSIDRNPQFNSNKFNAINIKNTNNNLDLKNDIINNNQQKSPNNFLNIKSDVSNQNLNENNLGKNVFSMNPNHLISKKTNSNDSMVQDSIEIDEKLKEIKMSQLNESKFPPEILILNPLKDKESQNILNEISNYLDKNEKDFNNNISKQFIKNQNLNNRNLKDPKKDLNNSQMNNFNDSIKYNIINNKEGISNNLNLNNSMLDNNNLNNSVFLNTHSNLNSTNRILYTETNRHYKNSLCMIENKYQNPNDLSSNLELNENKNLNNTLFNNRPQNLDNSIYIIKEGVLFNNNPLNKSTASISDEFNKRLCEKNLTSNNLLEMNNSLKNNFYQSVGNKTENDLKRERLILDKIYIEIQKTEIRKNQEIKKLNSTNLKKEEEIYLKSELKKINNKIDILKKEKEQQERFVKEAEAKLILKLELELKERLKNDRDTKFNTLTNNQLNNSMFNKLNFHSSSLNNTNNLQINNLNLSIHAMPSKIDKYNNMTDENGKFGKNSNKQINNLNDKLLFPNKNIKINQENDIVKKLEINIKSNANEEANILEVLQYENEEKERALHFNNLEKEMIIEKLNKKDKDTDREKYEQELMEKKKLKEKQEKEKLEQEKKEKERLEKIKLEKERKDVETKEQEFREKIENEKIAELMKKLEEEKQQRLLFEEKIKKLEADKKLKEKENNQDLNPLKEMEIKIMKNSEIINQELNNSFNKRNSNNTSNIISKNTFKFDLIDNKSNVNRNVNKYGDMNFNISSANHSFLNESKDKIKLQIDDTNNKETDRNISDNSLNNQLSTVKQTKEKKLSIYGNLNNSYLENSRDSKDHSRKSFDDIKFLNNLNKNIGNGFENIKDNSYRRKSDSSVTSNNSANNFINTNRFVNPKNNSSEIPSRENSKNNSFFEYNNIADKLDAKLEEKENKKLGNTNSSITSEKNTNQNEKYSFKSFIFANKSGDITEKSNKKEIINFDSKTKQKDNSIDLKYNLLENKKEKDNENPKPFKTVNDMKNENKDFIKLEKKNYQEMKESKNDEINNKENKSNELSINNIIANKELILTSESFENKDSISEINTPDNTSFINTKSDDKFIVVNVNESDEEDELDDKKFELYQDYVNKMKDMASETKEIENHMRQFTNIIKNIVTSNNAQIQNA